MLQHLDHLWSSLFNAPVLYADDLPTTFGVRHAWFVRSEYRSPIMNELNALRLRCHQKSLLVQSFFRDAVHSMNSNASIQRRITFIRRQHYTINGTMRIIGRRLLNEKQLIESTRRAFPDMIVKGVIMENMLQKEQISIMQRSNVVIGMHGAGMINVAFMHPEGIVIEIFPRIKRRYGYRNICAYLGIEYHEYRQGRDKGLLMDKVIDVHDWNMYVKRVMHRK